MEKSRKKLTKQRSLQMVHALEDAHPGQPIGILQQHLFEHNLPGGGFDEERREEHKGKHRECQQLEQHLSIALDYSISFGILFNIILMCLVSLVEGTTNQKLINLFFQNGYYPKF